jgi:Flp pilus assembly pilin Flp
MLRAMGKSCTARASSAPRAAERRPGFATFFADERGQAATEYILVVGLFVLFIVVSYNAIQGSLRNLVDRVAGLLSGPGI